MKKKVIDLTELIQSFGYYTHSSLEPFTCNTVRVIRTMEYFDYYIWNDTTKSWVSEGSPVKIAKLLFELWHSHGVAHLSFRERDDV